jgi:poly-gamma-glutamate capsule biosynthesis protein CapA/YwtB (metallophosphatase superfamily)
MRATSPTIGLMGDVMLGRVVGERLGAVPPAEVWSRRLRELCAHCDALVVNLECCISDRGQPTSRIRGKRFFFRAPPAAVDALSAVRVTAVGLANNHALDLGPDALADTLGLLDRGGIAHAGAGIDEAHARRGAVVSANGIRLGLLAVTDHPRQYAAGKDSWGVAYADLRSGLPRWVHDELAHLREQADLVLALPHWGPNMTVGPSAWQRRRAAELIAAGADAVAGHSAHVFHGIERQGGRLTMYDLGDALDDYAVDAELRNDLGVLALWRPGGDPELELVPLKLDFCFTDLASGADADWIAARLQRACRELGTDVERIDDWHLRLAT